MERQQRRRQMMTGKRGFTLLELLMVVIIIAILAAIALPQYFRTVERSRSGEALQVLAAVRGSQLRYYAQYLGYATAVANLDIDVPASTSWNFTSTVSSNLIGAARNGVANANVNMNVISGSVCSSNTSYGLANSCP